MFTASPYIKSKTYKTSSNRRGWGKVETVAKIALGQEPAAIPPVKDAPSLQWANVGCTDCRPDIAKTSTGSTSPPQPVAEKSPPQIEKPRKLRGQGPQQAR
jgi:hypothetical protein